MEKRIHKNRKNSIIFKAGFTFIELVMVIALLIAISGLTVVWLGNFLAARGVYSDAVKVSSLARLAGEISGSKAVNVRLYLDLSNRSYWLAELSTDGIYHQIETQKPKMLESSTTAVYLTTPRSSIFESEAAVTQDYVTFYPDGSAEASKLFLGDEKGNAYTLVFTQTTGTVKVFPGEYTSNSFAGVSQ